MVAKKIKKIKPIKHMRVTITGPAKIVIPSIERLSKKKGIEVSPCCTSFSVYLTKKCSTSS